MIQVIQQRQMNGEYQMFQTMQQFSILVTQREKNDEKNNISKMYRILFLLVFRFEIYND